MAERLLLKWGTVKGWDSLTDKSVELINRFFAGGVSMSCIADDPDQERRIILCELIDQLNGEIHNDWSGEMMSKEEAKKYIMDYQT